MPGHKFGRYGDLSQLNLSLMDATEASDLDNLYEAEGVIKDALEEMASFYGALDTLFLTNGSTAGILASILAVCKPGDQLLVARNCHHSVWSGLTLAGVVPVYIAPEYDAKEGIIKEMSPKTVGQALKLYPNVKGALIVSPTYEGITSDIKAISDVLHEQDKVLIVDEAHGAHFPIHDVFPQSSILLGADLVIQSMHKTLPTLTQSGLLHRGSERITHSQLISALKMVQTSSPSYVMMGLMDYMRDYLKKHQEEITELYIQPLLKTRKQLSQLQYLKLFKQRVHDDVSKIVILTEGCSIDGYGLAKRLEEEYSIVVESALPHMILLMTTVADDKETLSKLVQALMDIDGTLTKVREQSLQLNSTISGEIILGHEPRSIHFGDKEWIEISLSTGNIAARNIMLYPPGIPVVCIGEEISEEAVAIVRNQADKMLGTKIIDDKIYVEISRLKL